VFPVSAGLPEMPYLFAALSDAEAIPLPLEMLLPSRFLDILGNKPWAAQLGPRSDRR